MRKKKIVASILLVASTVGLITGCGSENGVAVGKKEGNDVVKIVCVGDATTEACKEVEEAASKITQEKFGVDIELVRLGYGSFVQEMNLMLSSGEKVDLIPNFGLNVTTSANNGQILELDDLLNEYGQDILKQLTKEEIDCVRVNGSIYAVPNNKEKAQGFGIAMRTDMLEATGIDPNSIKSENDLEPLFEKIKEIYPDTYPLVSDSGAIGHMMVTNDTLGGDYGVLENCLDFTNTKVVNWFETDTYRQVIEKRYKWAQMGYIMTDASTNTIGANSLINAGKGFSYFTNTKPGIEAEWSRKVGKDMTVIELVEPFSTTSGASNQWFIPHSSIVPEKAMQVLNEMYTNKELCDLFINGIEGKNYEVIDESSSLIGYPDGVDASNTSYSSVAWVWPNELISSPWESDGADIWKDTLEFNKSAKYSLALGFLFDNSNVMNEITACNNVTSKYLTALQCGSLEPKETIEKMNRELKEAGVDRIIEEKQKQFDEWLAKK